MTDSVDMAIECDKNFKTVSTANRRNLVHKASLGNLLNGLEKHFSSLLDVSLEVKPRDLPSKSTKQRKPSSTPRMHSQLSTRLSKECFNYEVISVIQGRADEDEYVENESKNEDQKEKELESYVKRQKQEQHNLSKVNERSMGLVKRKYTLSLEAEQRDLDSRGFLPRFSLKSNSRFCSRKIYTQSTDITKHFCDILGPGMCTDCTRERKQRASIDDSVANFPDISVSPYMLCVPCEHDQTKPKTPQVYKDCDMFRKRSMSRLSVYDVPRSVTCSSRPNSSSLYGYPIPSSCTSSPLPFSPTNCTQTSTQRYLNTPNSIPSHPSSRRSSIARYIDSNNPKLEAFSESESGNECQESQEVRTVKSVRITKSSKKRSTKQAPDRQKSGLHQNVFHKAISERTNGTARSTAIERRGKLSELPYWRFLIPEPPIMEVGRMNVSIYTPKDIPGIKIFDESLFDISVMS